MKNTLLLAFVLSFIVIISLPVWGDSTNDDNDQTKKDDHDQKKDEPAPKADQRMTDEQQTEKKFPPKKILILF